MSIKPYTPDEIDRFAEDSVAGVCAKCNSYDEDLQNGICFSCRQENENE